MYCDALFRDLNGIANGPDGERALVRELASRVRELAISSRMSTIKQRWRDVVELRKPDRPPVWCNPVGCWEEMLPEANLVCQDERCRELERHFKRLLIKHEIGDDTPMNATYTATALFEVDPPNVWGVDVVRERIAGNGNAWRYSSALVTEADFDRLVVPRYTFNAEATEARRAEIADILGDSMPVQVSAISGAIGGFYAGGTLCQPAADLRGMEQMMWDMIDAPELVHRLMTVMMQGEMAKLDAMEQSGYLLPNIDSAMFLSDPLRQNDSGVYDLMDCWVHGNSQEFDQISPAMFSEFLLEYQKKIFARFGASCYGCCENLTEKLDLVLDIPNLRLLTCSAWTDLPALVEKVQNRCCIMWRHKASDVVCNDDITDFKKQIFSQADILKGCSYQVVLRELQTLMGHDDRLKEWTQLSIEAVSR